MPRGINGQVSTNFYRHAIDCQLIHMSWSTLNQVYTECWLSIDGVHQVLIKGHLSAVIDAQAQCQILFEEHFCILKLLVNGQ